VTRTVITGLGAVTPIGNSVDDYWRNLTAGVSGIGPITQFDPQGLGSRIAAEVKGFDPLQYMDTRTSRRTARFTQFAIACARQALDDSGLQIDDANRDSIAVVMNTGGGGILDTAEGERVLLEKGSDRVSPFLVPILAANMASCQVAMENGIGGPAITSAAASAQLLDSDSEVVKAGILLFYSLLDEQQRRLFAGLEALRHDNDRLIADLFGVDSHTVAKGRRELVNQQVLRGRLRRPGGGRKATEKKRRR